MNKNSHQGHVEFSDKDSSSFSKGKRVFVLMLIGMLSLIVMSGFGSAGDCPTGSGWVFIDKASYNVCYLPGQNTTATLNITNNENNTLLEYKEDISSTPSESVFMYSNFSDKKEFNTGTYINYLASTEQSNYSTYGTYYFYDNFIIISSHRENKQNFSGQERIDFYNYGVYAYKNISNSIINNSFSGTGIAMTNSLTTTFLNNYNNYSIYSNSIYAKNNESSIISRAINNNNLSRRYLFSSSDTELSWAFQYIRKENVTQIGYSGSTGFINRTRKEYLTGDLFALIYFGDLLNISDYQTNYFNGSIGGGLPNQGMTGFTFGYDDCDDIRFSISGLQSTCSIWDFRESINKHLYWSRVLNLSILNSLILPKTNHLELNFVGNNKEDKLIADYNFYIPDANGVTNNALNNTHTRAVGDILNSLVQLHNLSYNISTTLIYNLTNHLETIYIVPDINTSLKIIPHSTNTQHYFDKRYVINTHTVGVGSLINAKSNGFLVNNSLLNEYLNAIVSVENNLYNSSDNSSFYSISSNGTYVNGTQYGSIGYIILEAKDMRVFYLYNKSNSFRNIYNQKISEMNLYWTGSNYTRINHLYSTTPQNNYKGHYLNLSILSFDNTYLIDKYNPSLGLSNYGFQSIPDGNVFIDIAYPVFLTITNTTFFIDREDNLMFETPQYAMIPDFKYDDSQKGMSIWIKWAYNTTGNFTNLSATPYRYFYDPQGQRFINFTEQRSWNATSSTLRYWIGNLSSSTTFRIEEGAYVNFSVDGTNLGLSNDSLWFSESTTTSRHIASNLSQTISGVTVVVNIENCDNIGYFTFTPNSGSNVQTIRRGDFTCIDSSTASMVLNNIEPSQNSNELTWSYGCSAFERTGYEIIRIAGALIILAGILFFSFKGGLFEEATIGTLIMMLVVAVIGIALFTASADIIANTCTP